MFIRVYREKEDKEILINVNSIWKIEVTYALRNPHGQWFKVGLEKGIKEPEAKKMYRIFFGGDESQIAGDIDDPCMQVLDKIYRDAIKGKEDDPDDED